MDRECWLEMDLYWFEGDIAENRVSQLFDRLIPLWLREPDARKGLSLCVGWLMDSVLYWNGDLDIPIPTCQPPTYEVWTYRRFQSLVTQLLSEANLRQISDFHVGILFMGTATMEMDDLPTFSGRTEETQEKAQYHIKGQWFTEHREVVDQRFDVFFLGAPVVVPVDEQICTLPAPTFGEYFADKLCNFAIHTGISAVVFRDHIFTPAYIRGYTGGRYMEPEVRHALNTSIITMLARIKELYPALITIGYSSGVSSMEEWRSNGFDLELVAQSGHLDLWITQTWASAWQDYWPCHSQGYTFQLANVLAHLAMLADTPCKHLFLIEMFDAWEPWDSIHQYPSKVIWEIWAYSHAAALLPDHQFFRSTGYYSSWMNRREELLPEQTVHLLRGALNDCSQDLEQNPAPGGPCVIYHRKGFECLFSAPTTYCQGEAWDDWVAMLLKYGFPLLSITRSEWLAAIHADGYVLPAGADLPPTCQNHLNQEIHRGKPVLLMGQASVLPEVLRGALGIDTETTPTESLVPCPAVVEEGLAAQLDTRGLVVNQRRRTLRANAKWSSLFHCLNGPIFAKHHRQCVWIWETPEWGTPFELHLNIDSIQSPQTYRGVVESVSGQGWGDHRVQWRNTTWQKPVSFLFWRYPDGKIAFLFGNLETGLCGNSQFSVKGTLSLTGITPERAQPLPPYGPGKIYIKEGNVEITLGPHKFGILTIS